jgi:UDP-glucose 4-epimerase
LPAELGKKASIANRVRKVNGLTALVTGAHGFIGRHVARELSGRGYRVTGIGHGAWENNERRVWGIDDWHFCDVTLETLNMYGGDPGVIVHCAGSGSVPYSVSHPLQDYRRTVDTMISVLEFARTTVPNTRIVVPSSAAVYGLANTMPIALNAPLRPISPYGVHKKVAEDLCRSYAECFGLNLAIVRFFSVYGVGLRKQLLWDACAKLSTKEYSFMGTGRETRDMLHVEDAVQLIIALAERASSACPIVNGGCGEAYEIRTVLAAVASALGVEQDVVFSGVQRKGDPTNYEADITETKKMGWKPTRSWRDEVAGYVDWYKSLL